MRTETQDEPQILQQDTTGAFVLDRAAKALLLGILTRGTITRDDMEILCDRTDMGGIRIIKTHYENG